MVTVKQVLLAHCFFMGGVRCDRGVESTSLPLENCLYQGRGQGLADGPKKKGRKQKKKKGGRDRHAESGPGKGLGVQT